MLIALTPKRQFKVPIDAECITPDNFAEKSVDEIAKLPIWEGNKKRLLNELFKIESKANEPSNETTIQIYGDVSKVRRIGAKMCQGKIIIDGDAGMHLGEEMKGGTIIVSGNAGSWTGSMMKDGTIEIKGDVGDYVGAPYRGSIQGMNGGTIMIHGNAGNELGNFMRKGLIKVGGNVGQFAGIHMKDGTILIQGNSDGCAGAEMTEGKIIVCGQIPSILPTFTIDSISPSTKIDSDKIEGPFYRFIGDLTENGNGKLFVSKGKNPHLNFYEKYLQ
jgi:formylmethanofuran dehydrogenase subunit C